MLETYAIFKYKKQSELNEDCNRVALVWDHTSNKLKNNENIT